jgi:hypothetical protein
MAIVEVPRYFNFKTYPINGDEDDPCHMDIWEYGKWKMSSTSDFWITLSDIDYDLGNAVDGEPNAVARDRASQEAKILKINDLIRLTQIRLNELGIIPQIHAMGEDELNTGCFDIENQPAAIIQPLGEPTPWSIRYQACLEYMTHNNRPRHIPFIRKKDDDTRCVNGSTCTEPKIFSWLKYTKLKEKGDNNQPCIWGAQGCSTVRQRENIIDSVLRGFGCMWVRGATGTDNLANPIYSHGHGAEDGVGENVVGHKSYRLNNQALEHMNQEVVDENVTDKWDDEVIMSVRTDAEQAEAVLPANNGVTPLEKKLLSAMALPCPGCQMNYYEIKYGKDIPNWNAGICDNQHKFREAGVLH